MKRILSLFLVCIMFSCTACSGGKVQPKTTAVRIPASYLAFARADIEENVKSYEAYGIETEIEGSDIVIKITDEQRKELMKMNNEFIEKRIAEFTAVDSNYKCTLSPDYSSVVYEYDEKLYEYDKKEKTHIQGTLLSAVTGIHVMNGFLVNNNPDWKMHVVIKNCHTGKVAAEAVLPEGEFFLGEKEWEASYKE